MGASEKVELLVLLREAEAKLRALGSAAIWSSYDSGPAIAGFIVEARRQIESGIVDAATQAELWGIFAPTCDWDDVIGDCELGDAIFTIVDRLYGPGVRAG